MEAKQELMKEKAQKVIELQNNTPYGVVFDADTILADIMENTDFRESGIGSELIDLWSKSTDPQSIESLFLLMTDMSFEAYLDRSIKDTTRPKTSVSQSEQEVMDAILRSLPMQGYEYVGSDDGGIIVRKSGDWDTHIRITVEEDPA